MTPQKLAKQHWSRNKTRRLKPTRKVVMRIREIVIEVVEFCGHDEETEVIELPPMEAA